MANEEDVYVPDYPNHLSDFWNEIFSLCLGIGTKFDYLPPRGLHVATLSQLREYLQDNPCRTIEECYLQPRTGLDIEFWRRIILKHPAKVVRLNQCICIVNKCKTEASIKMAINEILRLLYGKDHSLWFKEDECDPEKLQL